MKIISWNVNGIRAVEKKGFVSWVEEENPDILCLQETKAHESQLSEDLKNIEGYTSYWELGERKGYSGVAIYTKIKPLSVTYGFNSEQRFDCEGRIIIASYENFTLINIYFPNGQKDADRLNYKLDFYDATLAYCEQLKAEGKLVIICGDYNTAHKEIDIARPKANENSSGFLPIERAWMDKFVAYGYVDTLRIFERETKALYSWWSYRMRARENNVGWRLDYFFVTQAAERYVKKAWILSDVMGSDHCPVGIVYSER